MTFALLMALAPLTANVHWWLGSYNANYAAANKAFIAHHDVVDGVLHCCAGLSIGTDGKLGVPPSFLPGLVAVATEKKGSPLTVFERNAALRSRGVPVCLRAIGH